MHSAKSTVGFGSTIFWVIKFFRSSGSLPPSLVLVDVGGGDGELHVTLLLGLDERDAHLLDEHRQDDAAPHVALQPLLISQLLFRSRYREQLRTCELLLVELVTHEADAGLTPSREHGLAVRGSGEVWATAL